MTGLNLEPFLRLLRADVGAWTALGVMALLLALIAWTGWGSRRVLRKCLVLSVLAHLGLAFFGGEELSRLTSPGAPDGVVADEPGIREIRVTPPPILPEGGVGGIGDGEPGPGGRGGILTPDRDLAGLAMVPPDDPELRSSRPEPAEVDVPRPIALDRIEAPGLSDAAPMPDLAVPVEVVERPPAIDPGPEPTPEVEPIAIDPAEVAAISRDDRPAERVEPVPLPLPDPDRLASRATGLDRRDDLRPAPRGEAVPLLPELELPEPPAVPASPPPDDPAPGTGREAIAGDSAVPPAMPPVDPGLGDDGRIEAAPEGPAPASPGDPEAVEAPGGRPSPRPVDPPPLGLPEADPRVASRPNPAATPAARMAERSSGTPDLDLGRIVPSVLPDLPAIRGTTGGRPLLDVPEVYRPRLDPNRSVVARRAGASAASEEAVERALDWLARHQDADGRWDAGTARYRDGSAAPGEDSFTAHCPPGDICHGECYYWEADTALTGLSLLAFLGAGYTQTDGKYAAVVGRGIDFLIKAQRPDGDLRGPSRAVGMYCHAMASLALSEAYALSGDPKLRGPVERAVAFIGAAQYPGLMGWRYAPSGEIERSPGEGGRGWTYDPHPPVGDTSVLGWVVMVLKSAAEVGIEVPSTSVQSARQWLRRVADGESGGLARYQPYRPADPVMTAEAWVCRQFLGDGGPGPASVEAASYLLRTPPTADSFNVYYWYYATLAMYQNGGLAWERWNAPVRETLIGLQCREGHKSGSWDPDPTRYGTHGGRIYATALSAMTLEVYYRYLRLYASEGGATAGPPLAPSPSRPGDGALRRAGGDAVR